MSELDLRRELKHLFSPSPRAFELVDVPELNMLMIDGAGSPEGQRFQDAVQALYSVAYTLKFSIKKSHGIQYQVMPLEGLWWTDEEGLDLEQREDWLWTLMIIQPEFITSEMVGAAMQQARQKKGPASLDGVRLERFHERLCVQTMHIGPYSAEAPTIARMHEFMEANGYRPRGRHHEIYLGDPRRAAPEKLKTVLRHAVECM
ncbi:MAG: GyrI-like domain-containing protein [Firmicutes bacterium]|jgi:hypothetical protein|nr:GyrI-like domain-containing protein [Bacillota bacterium]